MISVVYVRPNITMFGIPREIVKMDGMLSVNCIHAFAGFIACDIVRFHCDYNVFKFNTTYFCLFHKIIFLCNLRAVTHVSKLDNNMLS